MRKKVFLASNSKTVQLKKQHQAVQDLAEALAKHKNYILSKGNAGQKIDADKWILAGVDFSGANLAGADLRKCEMKGSIFKDTELTDAILTDADLENADLAEAQGLISEQLGGTNLRRAKLPEAIATFEGLKTVEELAKNAGKLFLSMLLASAFTLLTIEKTQDLQLLTDAGTAKIPILDIDVSVRAFFGLSPVILLMLYVAFHLYLQRLWEALATLPAIFPDGATVDQKTYPWLLSDLVRDYFPRLSKTRKPLYQAQSLLFLFLGYWFVPLVTLPFWARALCRRDWIITGTHVVVMLLFVWAAIAFHHLAVITLRHDTRRLFDWVAWRGYSWYGAKVRNVAIALLCSGLFFWFSVSAFNGIPRERYLPHRQPGPDLGMFNLRRWTPRVLEEVGFRPFVNFNDTEMSVKPASWIDRYAIITPSPFQNVEFDRRMTQPLDADNTEIAQVKPAQLKGCDLRYADAARSFMVRADLRNANLDNASAMYSDLRDANLRNASLCGTNLMLALLNRADLSYSHLQKSDLAWADLRNTDLRGANLEGAFLTEANLTGALLANAKLSGANLAGADLRGCSILMTDFSGANLNGANLDKQLDLTGSTFRGANLAESILRGAKLGGADFAEANLQGADLRGADLSHIICTGANLYGAIYDKNTKWPIGTVPQPLPVEILKKRFRIEDPAKGY